MKIFQGRKLLPIGLVVSSIAVLGLVVHTPVVFAADCDPGTVAYSGGCCPTDREQLDQSGKVTCAAATDNCDSETDNNGSFNPAGCLFKKYINPAVTLLALLVGIAAVTGIIYGAIEVTSSAGDPSKVAAGKKRVTNAVIGLVAFILLYAFLQFLLPGGIFGGN